MQLRTWTCALLVVLGACLDSPDPAVPAASSAGEEVPDDAVFFEISVTAGPDGPVHSEPRPITAAQIRAQNAERQAMVDALERGEPVPANAHQDWGCGATSFWLYDQPNLMGNRLCIAADSGPADDFPLWQTSRAVPLPLGGYYYTTWQLRTGSYWAGWFPAELYSGHVLCAYPYQKQMSFTYPYNDFYGYAWISDAHSIGGCY